MQHPGSGRKVGLACAGGVVEGAFYEVGVLCALEEAIEGLELNRLDAYVGVSAGAIVVSCLANGISPREMARAIVSRGDPELNLRPELLFTPALNEYARRVGKLPATGINWLRKYLMRPFDLSLFGSLTILGRLVPAGLFDSRPLERHLARIFSTGGRTNDFRELRTRLRVVAVKLDSAELVTLGDQATAHVPISQAVQASTALPILYCPVEIEGEHYIDGVARRTLNASLALAEGADLLFCVNPIVPVDLHLRDEAVDETPQPGLVEYGLPAVLSQTFRTIIHSRMRTGFRNYEHSYPDADLVLIEPELSDHRMFFSNIFSFSNRFGVCEHAYRATRRFLLREADRLEPLLARHGLRLRRQVLEDQSRTLFADAAPGESPKEDAKESTVFEGTHAVLQRLDRALDRLAQQESSPDAPDAADANGAYAAEGSKRTRSQPFSYRVSSSE